MMKYFLFLSNCLIFAGGVTVLTVGIWTMVDKNQFSELVGSTMYSNSAILLIFTGSIVMIISFLGCVGALKEIKCMLLTYFIILLILFLFLLVAGILAYVFRDDINGEIEMAMKKTMDHYDEKEAVKQAWDTAQQKFMCCGVAGRADWTEKSLTVPKSCCKDQAATSCSDGDQFTKGCKEAVKMYVKDHATVIGGVGIGIACIMILGMVFSLVLYKMID